MIRTQIQLTEEQAHKLRLMTAEWDASLFTFDPHFKEQGFTCIP
jgi:hypothetical protein